MLVWPLLPQVSGTSPVLQVIMKIYMKNPKSSSANPLKIFSYLLPQRSDLRFPASVALVTVGVGFHNHNTLRVWQPAYPHI